jgi:hypothetical protein
MAKSNKVEDSKHYYTVLVDEDSVKVYGVLTSYDARQFIDMYCSKGYTYVHNDAECSLCLRKNYSYV